MSSANCATSLRSFAFSSSMRFLTASSSSGPTSARASARGTVYRRLDALLAAKVARVPARSLQVERMLDVSHSRRGSVAEVDAQRRSRFTT
jgi:hypothetical protein